MSLFQQGDFILHSGERSWFRIECDVLTIEDWKTIAKLAVDIVGPFEIVESPNGSARAFKSALWEYANARNGKLLIVDDVLTTGKSMEKLRAGREAIGVVVFARGKTPSWVIPLFKMYLYNKCESFSNRRTP